MTRALITGVSGQDGSYLAERLVGDGVEVHAVALESDPPVVGVEVHQGDITDIEAIRRLVLELAPDEIYNLAAVSSVAQSWEDPDLCARVNGSAAAALLESAFRAQERAGTSVRFVQASSAEIFGHPRESPQNEETPIRPVNPYGAAKAFAHHAVEVYRTRGLHAVSAILYNHESPRRPRHFVTRKITAGAAAIAAGKADRLTLGNIEARRDWGWAPDYAHALVLSARASEARDFVIATGESHSVREFVVAALQRVGIDDWSAHVEIDQELLRPTDAVELTGDATRAREALGWVPTVDFEGIVARMVDADVAAL